MSKRTMKHVAWVAPAAAILACSVGEPTGTDSSAVSGGSSSAVRSIHAGDGTELGRLAARFHLASYVLLGHSSSGGRDVGRAVLRDAKEETVATVDWVAASGSFTVAADRDAHHFGLQVTGHSLLFSRDGVDTKSFSLDYAAQNAKKNPDAFRAPADAVDPVELATAAMVDVVGSAALNASIPKFSPSRTPGASSPPGGPPARQPFDMSANSTCGQCYVGATPGALTPGAPISVAVGDGIAWTRTSICSTTDILLAESCSNPLCIGCYSTDGCNAICTVGDFLCFFAFESGTTCGGCDTSACSTGGGGGTGETDAGGGGDGSPPCGDGVCDSTSEDCTTCPQDCGDCPGGGECDVCTFSYPGECDSGYWCVDYGACLDDGASCVTIDPDF